MMISSKQVVGALLVGLVTLAASGCGLVSPGSSRLVISAKAATPAMGGVSVALAAGKGFQLAAVQDVSVDHVLVRLTAPNYKQERTLNPAAGGPTRAAKFDKVPAGAAVIEALVYGRDGKLVGDERQDLKVAAGKDTALAMKVQLFGGATTGSVTATVDLAEAHDAEDYLPALKAAYDACVAAKWSQASQQAYMQVALKAATAYLAADRIDDGADVLRLCVDLASDTGWEPTSASVLDKQTLTAAAKLTLEHPTHDDHVAKAKALLAKLGLIDPPTAN